VPFEAELVDERLVTSRCSATLWRSSAAIARASRLTWQAGVSQPPLLAITLSATSLGLAGQRGDRNVPPGWCTGSRPAHCPFGCRL